MCIRDRYKEWEMPVNQMDGIYDEYPDLVTQLLSLIHISEPTRLGMNSYAVFCLKKIRPPPTSTPLYSSAASDVYKRQVQRVGDAGESNGRHLRRVSGPRNTAPVSYTHLRAHETRHELVCRLLLEKNTATTDIYTSLFVGSVRCV